MQQVPTILRDVRSLKPSLLWINWLYLNPSAAKGWGSFVVADRVLYVTHLDCSLAHLQLREMAIHLSSNK